MIASIYLPACSVSLLQFQEIIKGSIKKHCTFFNTIYRMYVAMSVDRSETDPYYLFEYLMIEHGSSLRFTLLYQIK